MNPPVLSGPVRRTRDASTVDRRNAKHEVSGPIESGSLDIDPDDLSRSHVSIVIATSSLKVSGVDEPPEDRPKVQAAMESNEEIGRAHV